MTVKCPHKYTAVKFSTHGSFDVTTENNMLIAKSFGSFNLEGAIDYCNAIKRAVEHINHSAFGVLIDLTEFEGCTPDGWQEVNKLTDFLLTTNMKSKAIVASSAFTVAAASSVYQKGLQINTRAFEDLNEATDWLNKELGNQ
ncbi:STAS/SEC14 domain-containing protein [Aestuariibacter salexigens]|uniref:STAS/SEC14 domain-containing protein n=1 Tax=Aestuariibacter salexigens TaxID=226010 RepID=UPI0012EC353E|nr:STAS/SEC14 domain-containing protein [Aestuariibacter salexigens]